MNEERSARIRAAWAKVRSTGMALLFRLGPIIAGAALIVGFFTALWYLVLRPLGSGATGLYDEFLKAFRDADPNLRLIVASVMVLAFLAVIFWRPRRPVVNNADTSIDPFQLNILAGDGQRFTPRHVVYVNMLPAPTQFVSANHLTVYITRQHLIANTAGVPNIIVEVKRSNVPT